MMKQSEERDLASETRNLVPVDPPADLETLERHEVSEVFGDMDDEEWEDFLKEFTANPLPEFLLIILYDGKVLDGWHRLHAAIVTRNTHLLQFREYKGGRPGMIANFANANRRSLESSIRSAAVVRNYRYDRSMGGRNGDDVDEFPTDELADSARVSTRQMRRALNAEKAGLGDYVLSGEITAEDGEQIAKLGLAEKVRSGEMTIGEASKIVRDLRVERRRPKAPEAAAPPSVSDPPLPVDGAPSAPQAVSDPPLPVDGAPSAPPAVAIASRSAPPSPIADPRDSDGAAELDQVKEKYHQLRLDYDALHNEHVALKEKQQDTEEELAAANRRWQESMAECDALRSRVAELELAAGCGESEVEVAPIPESA